MDFYGLPIGSIASQFLRVDYLTSVGPRVIRLVPAGSDTNLLAELPDASWDSPNGRFSVRGGHRLWTAPEVAAVTYLPDDDPLEVEMLPGGVCLTQPLMPQTGLRKQITLELDADAPRLRLRHLLRNEGSVPLECGAWAITQVPIGGTAFIPQPQDPPNRLLPNRLLSLWAYTRLDDPRLRPAADGLYIDTADAPPFKLGLRNADGWLSYTRAGWTLRIRFEVPLEGNLPDFGCNCEVYTNAQFLELEALGPLQTLAPGEEIELLEVWEVEAA
jgi:hypothetical protein